MEDTTTPQAPVAPLPVAMRTASSCQTCGTTLPAATAPTGQSQPVLAWGKIRLTFPTESIEKQFAQVIGRHEGKGHTELELLKEVLEKPENRYLARLACWTLDIMDSPAYVLRPKDSTDYHLLVEALRPAGRSSIDVVVGEITGFASSKDCNNQQLPLLVFETAYIFEKEQLIKQMSKPEKISAKDFEAVAQEVFERAMRPNKGTGLDIPRNFVFLFYDKVYGLAARKALAGAALVSVDVQPSPVSGPHRLATVCLKFRHRESDLTERYCCTVNWDGTFPYLADSLSATL
jgi:cyclic patellamide precursor peptide PatG